MLAKVWSFVLASLRLIIQFKISFAMNFFSQIGCNIFCWFYLNFSCITGILIRQSVHMTSASFVLSSMLLSLLSIMRRITVMDLNVLLFPEIMVGFRCILIRLFWVWIFSPTKKRVSFFPYIQSKCNFCYSRRVFFNLKLCCHSLVIFS